VPESFCGSTWISVIAFLATLAARKSLVSRGESAVGSIAYCFALSALPAASAWR